MVTIRFTSSETYAIFTLQNNTGLPDLKVIGFWNNVRDY